jgi:hypothetical protein
MFSNERAIHSLGVANLMKEKVIQLGYSEQYAQEMFYLGFIHDIGYSLTDNGREHAQVGGLFLQKQQYRYALEVFYHGRTAQQYKSFELDLLNWADMHIDSKGNLVTFEERLEDIKDRYGVLSIEYYLAELLVEYLESQVVEKVLSEVQNN